MVKTITTGNGIENKIINVLWDHGQPYLVKFQGQLTIHLKNVNKTCPKMFYSRSRNQSFLLQIYFLYFLCYYWENIPLPLLGTFYPSKNGKYTARTIHSYPNYNIYSTQNSSCLFLFRHKNDYDCTVTQSLQPYISICGQLGTLQFYHMVLDALG